MKRPDESLIHLARSMRAGPRAGMIALALLTAVGAVLRVRVAHQSLFADELSTFWIVVGNRLGTVLSTVHGNAEITPPLFFVASWLTTQFGNAPELVRLPSLVAGIGTIPLIYLLGRRLVGRTTGLVAAALTTFSPFMIYYSAEARAYAVMMFMVALSTLAMLIAVDTRRTRWWVAYAVASAAAVYSHYTCVFVLGAQLLWLLWAHPDVRRAALFANVGAFVLYLPWVPGLIRDLRSPTTLIAYGLQPFTPRDVLYSLEHWSIGYPYGVLGLADVPGTLGVVLLALAFTLSVAGLAIGMRRERHLGGQRLPDRRTALVILLAVSVPVGAALASFRGNTVFSTRSLAASWPGFALLVAVLLHAAGERLRVLVAVLAVAGSALGGVRMLDERYQRPDYRAAADFIDREAQPGDVVVEQTGVLSPAPLSPLQIAFRGSHRVFHAGLLREGTGPLGPRSTFDDALRRALDAVEGGRIFLVETRFHGFAPLAAVVAPVPVPPPYRLVESRSFPGILTTSVEVYARPPSGDPPPS